MKARIEYTDLFCGQANYNWCERAEIDCEGLSHLQVVRRLKKLVGLDGVKAIKVVQCGDYFQYKIVGICQTFFIIYEY